LAEETSARAALELYQLGYEDARVIWGGMDFWEQEGLPMVKP